jgi:hypothetical protein
VTATRIGKVVVTQHGSLLEARLRQEDTATAGGSGQPGGAAGPSVCNTAAGYIVGGPRSSTSTSTSTATSATSFHADAAGPAHTPHVDSLDGYGYDGYDDDFDEESDDDYDFDRGDEIGFAAKKDGSVTGGGRAYQPREHTLSGMYNKIRVEKYDGPRLADSVSNKLMSSDKKVAANRIRKTDKSDRATTEQVTIAHSQCSLIPLHLRGLFVCRCVSCVGSPSRFSRTESTRAHQQNRC